MTQRDWAVWLHPALLLLWLPGCVTLSGPRIVTGSEGGSLSVQCQYEEKLKKNSKYWCREPQIRHCDKIVETRGSDREKRSGRVSIKDHHAQLTFTVMMWNLTVEDEGAYWCGIDTNLFEDDLMWDPVFQVMVSVFPAPPMLSTALVTESVTHSMSSQENSNQSQGPGSLLSSVHFLLLVFLKVPVFLSMLGAVLWVNRPQRSLAGRGVQL
ncbi:CMRF35-like molecule 6 [Orycteropus afer afer]|uniref:CMRF35-like molecule 6 n=1 Tax=Orycteropus afer afer TaxID=1230840 RepID=A0A8B7BEW8_ORYAF|nr:CMRF35-like molecule 6 [Orycteropus afer afer]